MRIDKFLWSVRLFKTRSLATDACKNGRVLINEMPVKPSREIKVGNEFWVKNPPIVMRYKVKDELKSRVGAKLVPDYLINITPEEDLEQLRLVRDAKVQFRDRGAGRPTKKERRDLDDFMDE